MKFTTSSGEEYLVPDECGCKTTVCHNPQHSAYRTHKNRARMFDKYFQPINDPYEVFLDNSELYGDTERHEHERD